MIFIHPFDSQSLRRVQRKRTPPSQERQITIENAVPRRQEVEVKSVTTQTLS